MTAHYKIPRYLKLTDEFPMTVTGKVQKFRMRELSVAELGLAGGAAERATPDAPADREVSTAISRLTVGVRSE